jgi:hypothetical protein
VEGAFETICIVWLLCRANVLRRWYNNLESYVHFYFDLGGGVEYLSVKGSRWDRFTLQYPCQRKG